MFKDVSLTLLHTCQMFFVLRDQIVIDYHESISSAASDNDIKGVNRETEENALSVVDV